LPPSKKQSTFSASNAPAVKPMVMLTVKSSTAPSTPFAYEKVSAVVPKPFSKKQEK